MPAEYVHVFLDYIMKSKIKVDITSTFRKTLKKAAEYCNITEKPYIYPFTVMK